MVADIFIYLFNSRGLPTEVFSCHVPLPFLESVCEFSTITSVVFVLENRKKSPPGPSRRENTTDRDVVATSRSDFPRRFSRRFTFSDAATGLNGPVGRRVLARRYINGRMVLLFLFSRRPPRAVHRIQRPVLHARHPAGHGVPAGRHRTPVAVAGHQPVAVPAAAVAASRARLRRPHAVRGRHRAAGRPARPSRQAPQTSQVTW